MSYQVYFPIKKCKMATIYCMKASTCVSREPADEKTSNTLALWSCALCRWALRFSPISNFQEAAGKQISKQPRIQLLTFRVAGEKNLRPFLLIDCRRARARSCRTTKKCHNIRKQAFLSAAKTNTSERDEKWVSSDTKCNTLCIYIGRSRFLLFLRHVCVWFTRAAFNMTCKKYKCAVQNESHGRKFAQSCTLNCACLNKSHTLHARWLFHEKIVTSEYCKTRK